MRPFTQSIHCRSHGCAYKNTDPGAAEVHDVCFGVLASRAARNAGPPVAVADRNGLLAGRIDRPATLRRRRPKGEAAVLWQVGSVTPTGQQRERIEHGIRLVLELLRRRYRRRRAARIPAENPRDSP